MPLYEYECEVCDNKFDSIESVVNRDNDQECPVCRFVKTHRVVSASNFIINGYSAANGYASKNNRFNDTEDLL